MTQTASPRSVSSAAFSVVVPPRVGLARLVIPGFASLTAGERLQAAALALRRDLSVTDDDLRVAARALPGAAADDGYAMVAWCNDGGSDSTATRPLATDLPSAVQPGRLYWVDAPTGYLVGEMGAVVVEQPAAGDALPTEVAAMLAARDGTPVSDLVFVNRDTAALSPERLALWTAASGVTMTDGAWPASPPVELLAPPRARMRVASTGLDRALRWALAAALVCAGLSAWRTLSLADPVPALATPAASAASSPHAAAGALFERIGLAAPDLLPHLQTATYAGGAWVLVLADGYDAASLQRAARMLESNGLVVQSAQAPGPRLRVALPQLSQSSTSPSAAPPRNGGNAR